MRPLVVVLVTLLLAAACSGSPATQPPTSAPTSAPTVSASTPGTVPSSAPIATSAPSATTQATANVQPTAPAIVIQGSAVTINPDALAALVFVPPAAGSADPFYHIHTTPAVDGFFLSIEAYTLYGPKWTGQLGTFAIDCSPAGTGICVHFDPDGPGAQPDLGKDFKVTGEIAFTVLSATAFDVTLRNITFSNGTTIAGPFRLRSR